jgi:serine/threonine-protein kinase
MGVVYKAFDERLNRHAVLKTFIPETMASADLRGRLEREAQAQARLQHDNIVTVYGLVGAESDLFIAMEYVDGETLEHVLEASAQPAMTLAEAMAIFKQILTALEYVHSNGVIHRDVKPSNVMISAGRVKLMDFGIALMADIPRQTATMFGTPLYMSPEQFDSSSKIDHRTDIYSAAVVLFEILAGRRPFKESEWLAAMQERLLPPPDLKSLVLDLPAGLCEAVAIGLRRDPNHRFKNIAEFHRALIEGVSGLLPLAPDPEEDVATVPQPAEPMPVAEPALPLAEEQSHTTLVWTVSLTIVFFSVVASIALLRKHSPSTVKTVVRTETVFIPQAVIQPPAPITPVSAPVLAKAAPSEKRFPFPNPLPVASHDDAEERRQIGQFRAEMSDAFKRAEDLLGVEKFDAVQAVLEELAEKVRRYPKDFWQEADEIRRLTNRLNDARVAAKTREMEEVMWQERLTKIEEQIAIKHFPEAELLAGGLIADSKTPEHIAGRARELLQEAKDGFSELLKGAHMGETKNVIRKPSSPPRN